MTTEIGRLIEEYRSRFKYPPTPARVARDLGVNRSTVSNWYAGSVPKPEHLRRLAQLIDIPYTRLTDAVLVDLGYLPKRGEPGGHTAATYEGEDAAAGDDLAALQADWDRSAAALKADKQRPLTDPEVERTLGPRPTGPTGLPGEVPNGDGKRRRRSRPA